VRLDDGLSSVAGDPVLTRADDGALAAAWKVEEHGAGAVAVLERRADGTPTASSSPRPTVAPCTSSSSAAPTTGMH